MRFIRMFLGILLGILLFVFAFQNTQSTSLSFFTLSFKNVPLFLLIILVFMTGFLSGRLTAWVQVYFRK